MSAKVIAVGIPGPFGLNKNNGTSLQIQNNGSNVGTPSSVTKLNFIGTSITFASDTVDVEITPLSIGADAAGSATAAAALAEQSAKNYADDGLALKLDSADYVQHFLGKYTSLGALQTAHSSAIDGDYAVVDTGSGSNARQYVWDGQDGWIDSGSIKAGTTTDELSEGSTNLFYTSARASSVAQGLINSALSAYLSIANSRYVLETITGTTYTLSASKVTSNGRCVLEFSDNAFTSLTLPTPTSLGLTTGDSVQVRITGTYAAQTLVAGSGATIEGTAAFNAQWHTKTLIAKSSTAWLVVG